MLYVLLNKVDTGKFLSNKKIIHVFCLQKTNFKQTKICELPINLTIRRKFMIQENNNMQIIIQALINSINTRVQRTKG